MKTKVDINDICDYIILSLKSNNIELNLLKLQKLIYYVECWYLANYDTQITDTEFQAWVHGPLNIDIFNRFNEAKRNMYSPITLDDVRPYFNCGVLSEDGQNHIDAVLEVYGGLTGTEITIMTQKEQPWLEARKGLGKWENSNNVISKNVIHKFYKDKIKDM